MARTQSDLPRGSHPAPGLEPTCVFHLGSHLHDGGDLPFLGGVYHHHGAAGHTDHTAQLSQQVQTLSQEMGGKDGTACGHGEGVRAAGPAPASWRKAGLSKPSGRTGQDSQLSHEEAFLDP